MLGRIFLHPFSGGGANPTWILLMGLFYWLMLVKNSGYQYNFLFERGIIARSLIMLTALLLLIIFMGKSTEFIYFVF